VEILCRFYLMLVQWVPLNGIIWLMGSNWPRFNKSQMSLNNILCIWNIFGSCFHSVNGISFGLAQSDPKASTVHKLFYQFELLNVIDGDPNDVVYPLLSHLQLVIFDTPRIKSTIISFCCNLPYIRDQLCLTVIACQQHWKLLTNND
jgi:hypothetical protein